MAERTVTVIQPRLLLPSLSQESGKQRVAAYARVSTDSDEQMGSVEAQKDYFEKLIVKRPEWEYQHRIHLPYYSIQKISFLEVH